MRRENTRAKSENEAIKAAETLREWCKQTPCGQCPYESGRFCSLRMRYPSLWNLPQPRRWSDADVVLAKALIENGYDMISSVSDRVFSITGNRVNSIYLDNGVVFKPFKVGEVVMLKDIVEEGEQE